MSKIINIAAGASSADIQKAIDSAPDGATIKLAAGTYNITKTIVVDRSDISIEGAGSGKTIINVSASLGDDPAFQIGAPKFKEKLSDGGSIAAVSDGATSVTMTGGDKPKPGDVIWIEAANDSSLFKSIGDTLWKEDKPLRTAMAVVVSVSGDKVVLDRDLPMDFPKGSTIHTVEVVDDVSLSGMTFKGAYGNSDPTNFTNKVSAGREASVILANGTTDLVMKDIDIDQPVSNGIVVAKSIDPMLDNISVTGAHNKGDSGNGYGLQIRDVYDGSFTNLEIFDTRHAVVFASYTSANGNYVEVDRTNRDINFHGGLDTDNRVVVHESLRDSTAEQDALGTVVFYNPGTSYGAPTDATTNVTTFEKVIGSKRADIVAAADTGASIKTMGGDDTVWGGDGNDNIDGGNGHDIFYHSAGTDAIVGGSGTDTLIVDGDINSFGITRQGTKTILTSAEGTTTISEIEKIAFTSGTVDVGGMKERAAPVLPPPTVNGTEKYDIHSSSKSLIAGKLFDAVNFTGSADVTFDGNALSNRATGNSGDNTFRMGAGNDVAFGKTGNDTLYGGDGNDLVAGGTGNDHLRGDGGNDTLRGDGGADVYYASGGENFAVGFSVRAGDTFVFDGHSTKEVLDALEDWETNPNANTGGFSFEMSEYAGYESLRITSSEGDSLTFVNYDSSRLLDVFDAL